MKILFISVITFLLLGINYLHAAHKLHNGTLTVDETWYSSDTHEVDGNLTINCIVTIEAGCDIQVDYPITVGSGKMIFEGVCGTTPTVFSSFVYNNNATPRAIGIGPSGSIEADNVIFKCQTQGQYWSGISYSGDNSFFNCCSFDGSSNYGSMSYGGIFHITGQNLTFDLCSFTNSIATNGGAFYMSGANTITINNSKITNNKADFGGAIWTLNTYMVSINYSRISNNTGSYGGSLMDIQSELLFLTYCNIDSNTALQGGGVALNGSKSAFVNNCNLRGNSATTGNGGGVFSQGSKMVYVTGTELGNNYSYLNGGGIYSINNTSQLFVGGNNFNKNKAVSGAGIYQQGSTTFSFSGNMVRENEALRNGGGIAVVSNTTLADIEAKNYILNNSCGDFGGGIYIENCKNVDITRNYISYNTARDGGGICFDNDDNCSDIFYIVNNLIDHNESLEEGAGIALLGCQTQGRINSNTIVDNFDGYGIYSRTNNNSYSNNIIWENTAGSVNPVLEDNGNFTHFAHNNIQNGNYQGYNNIDSDPIFVDPSINDYRISNVYSSPCINSGTNDSLYSASALNAIRIVWGTIDMGAYEYEDPAIPYRIANTNTTEVVCNVYPNPVVDDLTIEFSNLTEDASISLKLIDISGKIIFSTNEISTNTNYVMNKNLSHLSVGVYYLMVQVNNETPIFEKIIVN